MVLLMAKPTKHLKLNNHLLGIFLQIKIDEKHHFKGYSKSSCAFTK